MRKNRKVLNIIIIIIIIIVLLILGLVLYTHNNIDDKRKKKLTKLGEKFYDYYYVDNSDKKDSSKIKKFLSEYNDSGITIDLDNLQKYLDTKKVEDYSLFSSCDKKNTYVKAFPYSPYSKKDRIIKVKLDCE